MINNEYINSILRLKYDKLDNNFSKDELDNVDSIVIFGDKCSINDIKLLTGLKSITLVDFDLFTDDIYYLFSLNLDSISFKECSFDMVDHIKYISCNSISFVNCDVIDYSFIYNMSNLTELCIVNSDKDISIKGINKLVKLEYLRLSYSKISLDDKINLINLKVLDIDNTDIMFNDVVFNNIEKISIDKKQYDSNKEDYDKLDIDVLFENIISCKEM